MIKRMSAVLTAFALALALAACSDSGRVEITTGTTTEPPIVTPEPTTTTTTAPPETTPPITEETTTTTVPFVPSGTTEFDKTYFEQCAFVGDSVCSGLRVYGGLLSAHDVFAAGSVGARNIHDFTFTVDDVEYTIEECIQNKQPMEIFLWMGLNDINMTWKETYFENLKKLADELLAISPDSKINIMGMTPTTEWHTWGANDRIKDYNEYVRQMCEENGITYIETWEAVAPGLESLPDECQSGDGLHLSPYAYQLVLGYITEFKGLGGTEPQYPVTEPVTVTTTPPVETDPAETEGNDNPSDYTPTGNMDFNAEYLEQCAFVGDSVCSGLYLYGGLLSDTSVFAQMNVTARNIKSYTFEVGVEEYDIITCIENKQPKEIFFWMGLNDIQSVWKQTFFDDLDKLAQECLAVSPNSKINIVGMTPTTSWHKWGANDRIKEYNEYVREMCQSVGYTYIDAWQAVAPGEDYLADICQSGDGLHLTPYAYKLLLGYITDVKGLNPAESPTLPDEPTVTTPPTEETQTTIPIVTVMVDDAFSIHNAQSNDN